MSNFGTIGNVASETVTASRDALLSDDGKVLICNSASAITITIESDTASGWNGNEAIAIYQMGAGASAFAAGAGVTIQGTAPTATQYTTNGVYRVAANEWTYL